MKTRNDDDFVHVYRRSTFVGNSELHPQDIEKKIADRFRKGLGKFIVAVENRVQDAILTAIDSVVERWVEMAVRSAIGSWGERPNSVVQNPNQRDFSGNMEDTPVMTASSCADSNTVVIGMLRLEITKLSKIEGGNFLALKSSYDWHVLTHHNCALESFPWVKKSGMTHSSEFNPLFCGECCKNHYIKSQ